MAIRIGIIGLGFMGAQHWRTYARVPGAEVVAACDVDARKRAGDWSAIGGNIGTAAAAVDLSACRVYADIEALLQDAAVDVVDITLPTYLHASAAVRAMEAGKHVICEKPMARTLPQAEEMLAAARRTGRHLYIAQCIRCWPAYVEARRIVQGGQYGRVRSAIFARRSCLPTWSWEHWLLDPAKSGGCVLDLHIHDADFILSCFGPPAAVSSVGVARDRARNDHVVTTYHYPDGALIMAEGAWGYPPSYPFSMTFSIALEAATLRLDATGQLILHPEAGEAQLIPLDGEDGYYHELTHFVHCIAADTPSTRIPPESAYRSLQLVMAEMQALQEQGAATCAVS